MLSPARTLVVTAALCLSLATAAATAASPVSRARSHGADAPRPTGLGWLSPFGGLGSLGTALVGSTPTGEGPSQLAVDSATHTVYVVNGNNLNGPLSDGGDTVSVIDSRHCQALDVSRCQGPWPTIKVGNLPSSVAVDEATDTVYVTNAQDNTVSVFNGATCDAADSAGCTQVPATVPVGASPVALYVDDANHTVYVANEGDTTLSMIDTATCDAADLAGCPTVADPPPTVDVENPATTIGVDQATHTVYVGTYASTTVFDARTCNAAVQTGCGTLGLLVGDAFSGPSGLVVDAANDTMYSANYDDSISAFDLSHCNAGDLAGCATDTPGTVLPFPYSTFDNALWLVLDARLHTVYVIYQQDGALFAVDTNVCNAGNLAACATLHPPAISTGDDPLGVDVDEATQTLYTGNYADNTVSVIDASRCNATVTSGCRHEPPTVPISQVGGLAADPGVSTLYATTASGVSMVNTRTCNAAASAGCASTPEQFTAGTSPTAVAIDPNTHTVYIANFGTPTQAGTVSVVDADACNATDSVGCTKISTLQVPGGNPDNIEVDAATDTVYVATTTAAGANLLSVFNGATCNATTTTGCAQTPGTLPVGDSGGAPGASILNIAVNEATNTIYATNITFPGYLGTSVYVINGATCDAAHPACSQAPTVITPGNPSAPGGLVPWGIAIDELTDTIYVVIQAQGDYAGTVAVINGATCNGINTSGCSQIPPTVPAGYGASSVAIDPITHTVYTTNTEDASLSAINGFLCNRIINVGCKFVPPKLAAGDYPSTVDIDPAAGTAYVDSFEGLSVIALSP